MKIKAIFFDQDNTIFDTKKISGSLYKDVIEIFSKQTKESYERIYMTWQEIVENLKTSQNPTERTFLFSFGLTLKKLNISSELLKNAEILFHRRLKELINLTSGTLKFIKLRTSYKKILFTEDSKSLSDIKLDKFKLKKYFDLVITSDDINKMKPDISYLEFGWQKLNLKPVECIYIGDNWEKDCKLGQEQGGIGIVFGNNDKRANYSINNMMELQNIINENLTI